MRSGGLGGGNTQMGSVFEGKTDLSTFLVTQEGYTVEAAYLGASKKRNAGLIYFNHALVAKSFKQHGFYTFLQETYGIEWKSILSKKLLLDDALFVLTNGTLYVIECKFQQVAGSVDEKLQTCDFKKRQYKKLMAQANIEVEYVYLLSDWFKAPAYKDVLDYIHSVGCHYYFEFIPLAKLGLPTPLPPI